MTRARRIFLGNAVLFVSCFSSWHSASANADEIQIASPRDGDTITIPSGDTSKMVTVKFTCDEFYVPGYAQFFFQDASGVTYGPRTSEFSYEADQHKVDVEVFKSSSPPATYKIRVKVNNLGDFGPDQYKDIFINVQ